MKLLAYAFATIFTIMAFASCDDTETYAEQKDRERSAIQRFIRDSAITVISEAQFKANGCKTDLKKNEYVLMQKSGVYMQIINEGCGEKIKDGETASVLCRFNETNILTDSLQLSNEILIYSSIVDKMNVTNTSGTFTASFVQGQSVMYMAYQSTSVPSGWLVPLTYVKVGRPQSDTDEIAYVKLIVPHTQGQQYASSSVYPCFYTLKYQRGL